jgi:hypothetical protein
MATPRKPIPKTQREISISLQEPYNPPKGAPGFQYTGNPSTDGTLNRAEQTSFKNDTVKPLSIGIQDIDESVMYYFQNVIKPSVMQNGERIPVPIIYGSPEKWKSFQVDGYYRDVNGRIMAPLIMFKRDNIEKIRDVANKLDANEPHNIAIYGTRYSKTNEYSKFTALNGIIPAKTYYATVVPDYLSITYDCVIFTYYNDQLAKIIEAVEYASDSYWGDPERFKFQAKINSFSTTTELSDNGERVVRSAFTIKLFGYIIPDIPQKDLNAVKKFSSKTKLSFTLETVEGTKNIINTPTDMAPARVASTQILDSPNIVNNVSNTTNVTINVDSNILTYLTTNKPLQATSIPTDSTAVFTASFLVAPDGFPLVDKTSFTYFINGQLVEPAAITDFVDNGDGTCTLILDTTELGFTLESTDEVVAIGKFA